MEYRLDELFDLQMGKTPARKNPEYWNSNDYKWISIADLSKCEKYITETKEHISSIAVQESGISEIPANTVIMSFKLSIGKTAITKEPIYSNEAIMSFRDKGVTPLLPDYIYYMFSGRDWSKGSNTAVMGTTLNKATLSQIRIYVHAYEDQKRIVELLDKVSSIISKRKQELVELDDLIKARFIELFGDPQRNPHGYKHTKLSDIATYYNGLTYKPENVATEGTIVLRSSNIQNSQLDFADTVRVDCAIKERLMVQKNDILMCSRNGSAKLVGKVALIKDIQEPMSFGAFMMIIRSHYFGYLMTYFQMDAFRQQIKTSATTTINQITGRMLDDVTIPLPPMSLVDKFATFVEQIDKSKLLSGCRLFHSWAPENRDKPKHVGVPRRRTKDLRGGRRQQ